MIPKNAGNYRGNVQRYRENASIIPMVMLDISATTPCVSEKPPDFW